MILMHFVSNMSFVFLPLLPENRGGDLTAFSIFVGLATILAAAVVGGRIGKFRALLGAGFPSGEIQARLDG